MMTTVDFEVAIIGSGPGGAATAFHLATAGVRVALFDRSEFPRPKVCGDGLTPRAVVQLNEIKCLGTVGQSPSIDSLIIVDPTDSTTRNIPLPGFRSTKVPGTVVRRVELDEALRKAAVGAGASFLGQTEIQQLTRDGDLVTGFSGLGPNGPVTVRSRVTVVAEGSSDRLSRTLRTKSVASHRVVAVRQYLRLRGSPGSAFRVYVPILVGGESICGYGWLFPVNNDWANVGLGVFSPTLDRGRINLRSVYASFVETLRRQEQLFVAKATREPLEGGTIRVGLIPQQIAFPGALLVGDAAAVANPFTGEGIAHAIESGRAAAEAIVAHLGDGRDLRNEYTDRVTACFPHATEWAPSLPWIAERGSVHAGGFSAIISDETGKVCRAIRSLALEEQKQPDETLNEENERIRMAVSAAWAMVETRIARNHPLLATLVRASRIELSPAADSILIAFLKSSKQQSSETLLSLAFLTLASLVADDVQGRESLPDHLASKRHARWAANAVRLGMSGVLISECFLTLAALPRSLSSMFASHASQTHMRLLGDSIPPSGKPRSGKMQRELHMLATTLAAADVRDELRVSSAEPTDSNGILPC